jgi:hypothetical protein
LNEDAVVGARPLSCPLEWMVSGLAGKVPSVFDQVFDTLMMLVLMLKDIAVAKECCMMTRPLKSGDCWQGCRSW